MSGQPEFTGGWRERMAALRNVPAVLRFVWESGRTVVVLGLIFRVFSALLPLALFWVSKLIIDAIQRVVTTHQPAGTRLWWLAAMGLARQGLLAGSGSKPIEATRTCGQTIGGL